MSREVYGNGGGHYNKDLDPKQIFSFGKRNAPPKPPKPMSVGHSAVLMLQSLPSRRKKPDLSKIKRKRVKRETKEGEGEDEHPRLTRTRARPSQAQMHHAPQNQTMNLKIKQLRDILMPHENKSYEPVVSQQETELVENPVVASEANAAKFERALGLETGEDAITFFARNGNNTPVKFVYCNRAETGDEFRPYDLVCVSRKKINLEYFTISATGVVHVGPNAPSEFISLAEWMHQSTLFNILRSIRFFKHYLIAKTFRLWRSNVRYRVYCKQRKLLQRNLFLARESFCKPLLEVNHLMYELDQIKLSNIKSDERTGEAFEDDQNDQRNLASKKIEAIIEKLDEKVDHVCNSVKERARAYDHGIKSDDLSNSRFAQHLLGGNGRIKPMVQVKKERAERIRRLKHAKLEADMLKFFIRLVDYMEVEHLVSITTETMAAFLRNLSRRTAALFITRVSFGPDKLMFDPDVSDIHKIISNMCEGTISTVDTVDRILYLAKFKPYIQTDLTSSPKVAQIIHNDRLWIDTRNGIAEKIDRDFEEAEQTVSKFERHRPVYEFGLSWDFAEYCEREHSVDSIRADMQRQTDWTQGIKRVRDNYTAGIFQVETKRIKDTLLPETKRVLDNMKELLLKIFQTNTHELYDQFQMKIKQMDEDPTTLPGYADHVEQFTQIQDEAKSLHERAKRITVMHGLLSQHDMKIPSNDIVLYEDLQSSLTKFDDTMNATILRIEEHRPAMRKTVHKNILRLNQELIHQKTTLQEGIFVDEKVAPKEVLKALEQAKAHLDDIKDQTETLQGYQRLFKQDVYPFATLPETFEVYEKKQLFWSTYQNWIDKANLWNKADFLSLNVEEMDAEVKEFYNTAYQVNREAKGSAVTLKLKNLINDWQRIMPYILELGNPALKPSHWRDLFTSLGHGYYPNEKIKLKKLRQLGVFNRKPLITEICETAVGEYQLEQSLAKITKIWQNENFVINDYPKAPNVWILGDVEEVTQKLEDNQLTLQNMLGSPFILAVKPEVEHWDKKLAFLSEVLDEWIICQRNWMSLEPIFGAEDIKRQLPTEAKQFQDVDRMWREVMRKARNNPNVMSVISSPGLLQQFQKANAELEKIQKLLEEYLETKRAAFPRFYFLSNDELLLILCQSRQPRAVQPHLRKCFDSIASLRFEESKGALTILGMKSGENEYVDFMKPTIAAGATEAWLGDVESMMRMSMKMHIKRALFHYPTNGLDRADWFGAYPAQPVLVVDQMMWTKGIDEALATMYAGGNPKALADFLEFVKKQIASMVDMVRGSLSKLLRRLVSTIILLDVHGRDVIEGLVDRQVTEPHNFDWKKQMRYYWHNEDLSQPGLDAPVAEEKSAPPGQGMFSAGGNTTEEQAAKQAKRAAEQAQERAALQAMFKDPSQISEYEDCIVRQTNARFVYRYEYLGNTPRLVVTPLTDKCYLTLTGALHLQYGGAPAGPAGTGKTETVKDLAKALANQIVVFNCSEGLDVQMMARFFSGLAQAGAWACFDEFNRIDIEVLSVIAQQILTIQEAIRTNKSPFEFEGRLIPLDKSFGVFITMNPGYAGRTELPDNLKALFRPVAMMVPDYALIAQIVLFSEGFQTATPLSKKMVQLYRLSSEQLSKQDHYDFGMRAVKSVLVMAGSLKRSSPNTPEDAVLIRAMRDSNIPKFLSHDLPLFKGIIADLFPGVEVPTPDYGDLQVAIENELKKNNKQCVPDFITKVLQLHETTIVRHGVMLVGQTMTGKSTCAATLAGALSTMKAEGKYDGDSPFIQTVQRFSLNPKAVTMGELYGQVNRVSNEWSDGLVADLVRKAVDDTSPTRKWVVFDGPVDALWIENMNTVLDDNKTLCLPNAERIKLPSTITMLFEVENLAVASPATVSRCGMVYLENVHLGWRPIVQSWKVGFEKDAPSRADFVYEMLDKHVDGILKLVSEECTQKIEAPPNNLVLSCLRMLDALMLPLNENNEVKFEVADFNDLVNMQLFLSIVWSFGANLHDDDREKFSNYLRESGLVLDIAPNLPSHSTVFDFCVDPETLEFMTWTNKVEDFVYDSKEPYFSILVPTTDTTKYAFFLDTLATAGKHVMFMGETGVGKTVVVQDYMRHAHSPAAEPGGFMCFSVCFSAQTTSLNFQDALENKLVQKRKNLLGAPAAKKMLVFVDDLNMPQLEEYGAQPPIELLRETVDDGGFYDRKKLFFKKVVDTVFVTSCGPPGGGRNTITQRLTHHFNMIWQPQLSEASMKKIFTCILSGFLADTASHWVDVDSKQVATGIVDAAVSMYFSIQRQMLPTPAKTHYTFNLRDLGKVIQGICQVEKQNLPDMRTLLRLWLHESARVFRDRLVCDEDRSWFNTRCRIKLQQSFNENWQIDEFQDLVWGDYIDETGADEKLYAEMSDPDELAVVLQDYLKEYNLIYSNGMDLVFFKDAVAHLTRISRILRQPRGNALLVGVGGSGRQSLTRLATFIANYKLQTIEITRGYSVNDWREALKRLLEVAGADNSPVVFLLTDQQLVNPTFLEDINNLLNTGEVPNLFESDELDPILAKVRPLLKAAGKLESRENMLAHFVHLCRENLHIVLAFSPAGDGFRNRCRRYPSLVNCCTIDWFNEWPNDALYSVAEKFLDAEGERLGVLNFKDELCKMCVKIHTSVAAVTHKYLTEKKRYNYTTPTSYLELIKMYVSMLTEEREEVTQRIYMYRNGLTKLQQTNEKVDELKQELIRMQPILQQSSQEASELLVVLQKDQEEASKMQAVCKEDAEQCAETTRQVQVIKDDCQANLEEALPAYEAAIKALDTLDKNDITVMKSFTHPPEGVKNCMAAVCLLFSQKQDWDTAKRMLNDTKFLDRCRNYNKDAIPRSIIKKLQKFIHDPTFVPEKLESVSTAAVSLCQWVRAMDIYARVAKQIAPKRKALAAAEDQLAQAQATLAGKEMQLRVVEQRVANLEAKYKAKQDEKRNVEANIQKTTLQLERAEQLTHGLASEQKRWAEVAESLSNDLTNLVGNIMLSAGCISYCGPFTADFRDLLVTEWNDYCTYLNVPVDEKFSLVRVLSKPIEIRRWRQMGLPADDFSTENGLFVTKGRRWPLMIDPQAQANRWIKNLGRRENITVIKLGDKGYLKHLENAIRYGQPCLLENVSEELEPAIEPVLTKQIFKKGGQWLLRLNDQDIPFSHDFRFYITTKLPNPHYLPEIFVKVTVINFTVTPTGLEDQLLVVVCGIEEEELEEKSDRLTVQIANDKKELSDLEQKILKLLSESEGNILDDVELIDTLKSSKETSTQIEERMKEALVTFDEINVLRDQYRPVATRASILYFVIADMAGVDPMYQYSLQYFTNLYKNRILNTEKSEDLPTRLNTLLDDLVASTYLNICRALFEKDKLLFAFLCAVGIARGQEDITDSEWSFFVKGADLGTVKDPPENPCNWLDDQVWLELVNGLPEFSGIIEELCSPSQRILWKEWTHSFNNENPTGAHLPEPWNETLSDFQQMLVKKVFRKDRTIFLTKEYVTHELGAQFIKPPPFDLKTVYAGSDHQTPIVFVLSPGANPMPYLQKLAKEMGKDEERFKYMSLGQGQGPIAAEMMENARRDGDWVCLQNCHLAVSWMPSLERILEAAQAEEVHEEYRLFLTSMPSSAFPASILQSSIKITNEPPKGLANNVMRTFLDINEKEYESCSKPQAYKKLVFGLAFFHAVCQERRKFGAIGWNIPYEWMDSDQTVSRMQIKQYLEENAQVPWTALREIIGEVNYAGRVTDYKDQRCVRSILKRIFNPNIILDDFKFTDSDIYYAPPEGKLSQVREYVDQLPLVETPEAFGLHDNADITFQLKETKQMLTSLVAIQPSGSTGADGKTPDELVQEKAEDILAQVPQDLDKSLAHPTTFEGVDAGTNTLGVFLGQELERFNKLLAVLRSTLANLRDAIKGLVVMSVSLEEMHRCFLFNIVPKEWEEAAYPSLMPLAAWIEDLFKRVETMREWILEGPPASFWVPGFFFPQGFMTSVLQKYARKTKIPIDTLCFDTHVLPMTDPKDAKVHAKGVNIHGLYLQGAEWDYKTQQLKEPADGQLFAELPIVWLNPIKRDEFSTRGKYECPLYKTARRAGVLSTTGHSTNFVLDLHLPTTLSQDHWIRRGTALLTMTNM